MWDKKFEIKDSEEAVHASGLNFGVKKRTLYMADGREILSHYANVHGGTDEVLGVVGSRYQILQNSKAFKFMDDILHNTEAVYIGGGQFRGGETTYLTAKLSPEPMVIAKDDIVEKYFLMVNNHNGKYRPQAILTPIRLVCTNQLSMMRDSNDLSMKFSHTKIGLDRLDAAESKYKMMIELFDIMKDKYKFLASRQADFDAVRKYVDHMFPIDEMMLRTGHIESAKEKIVELFENGRGSKLSTRGSYWNLYNAFTEYIDWHAGTDKNREEVRSIGGGVRKKMKAFTDALAMANGLRLI